MDECNYGSQSISWSCIENCYEAFSGCGEFASCIQQNCGSSLVGSDSDEEDEDEGGICG